MNIDANFYYDMIEHEESIIINGINLSMFVPKYRIIKKGFELGGKSYVVHLKRKSVKRQLFLKAFFIACATFFKMHKLNPDGSYARVYYKSDGYYSMRRGKIAKNSTNTIMLKDRLSWSSIYDKKFDNTYYFVKARFSDPNSDIYYDFSIEASSLNVRLFIGKEFRERVVDYESFDYASFFHGFLFNISYPRAIYMINRPYSLHRLLLLQHDLEKKNLSKP